jgi:hypothetical protein
MRLKSSKGLAENAKTLSKRYDGATRSAWTAGCYRRIAPMLGLWCCMDAVSVAARHNFPHGRIRGENGTRAAMASAAGDRSRVVCQGAMSVRGKHMAIIDPAIKWFPVERGLLRCSGVEPSKLGSTQSGGRDYLRAGSIVPRPALPHFGITVERLIDVINAL